MAKPLIKYKNALSRIKSEMTKNAAKARLNNPVSTRGSIGEAVDVSLGFKPNSSIELLRNKYSLVTINIPWKFKAVESNGSIYIGQDLDAHITLVESDRYGKDFASLIANTYFDIYCRGRLNDPLSDKMLEEIRQKNYCSKENVYRDKSLLEHSKTFLESRKMFYNVLSSIDVTAELKSGIHPGLDDRKIYPYIVFDVDKMQAFFFDGAYTQTSRQNRKTVTWEYLMGSLSTMINYAFMFAPLQNFILFSGSGADILSFSQRNKL